MVPHSLEDAWQPILDAVLRRRAAPVTSDVARLGARVAVLSRAYNEGATAEPVPLDARIGFSFARDVPKGAAAVRELVATRRLVVPRDRPLRVLDLGAGVGAMTWGVVRALAAAGQTGRVEALLVDADEAALGAATEIAREATVRLAVSGIDLAIRTRRERLDASMSLPESDLVVMGQVLSELDTKADPASRVAEHAELVRAILERAVTPEGSLVVVEPALRVRTRHLHAVRDRVIETGATLFAPCLHAKPCPALVSEGDWCHEDLPVDLPSWLAPVARAAGLRWQGLTFSYFVLRRDGVTLDNELGPRDPGRLRLRVVSDRRVTKGKAEIHACTEAGERRLLRRLDRDLTDANAVWDDLKRGDVVTLNPNVDGERIGAAVDVDVWRVEN